jgi:hypothetical protein
MPKQPEENPIIVKGMEGKPIVLPPEMVKQYSGAINASSLRGTPPQGGTGTVPPQANNPKPTK